jgi:hypothetical protein
MKELFVKRIGNIENSFMITKKLIDIFTPNQALQQINNKLIKSNITNNEFTLNTLNTLNTLKNYKKPKQIIIRGKIEEYAQNLSLTQNNILGSNDYFYISSNLNLESNLNQEKINIPIEETSNEYLGYYNVYILEPNQIFNLNNNKEIGFFEISIGPQYVDGFLLQEELGDGFYIESHDLPHYYFSSDKNSGGYLVLGEKIDEGFAITAFEIGPNKHIYISPYTFHSDAYLVGNYNVIYGKANNYKTYLFRKENGSIIKINCE